MSVEIPTTDSRVPASNHGSGLRVAIVDTGLVVGGTHIVAAQLARALAEHGCQVLVVHALDEDQAGRVFPGIADQSSIKPNFTYSDRAQLRTSFRRFGQSKPIRVLGTIVEMLADLRNLPYLIRLWREFRRFDADIIHVNNGLTPIWSAFIARRPAIVHLHGLVGTRLSSFERFTLGRCAHVIAISECVANAAVYGGIVKSRITTIPNFIYPRGNIPSRSSARHSLGIDPEATVVSLVARVVPWKGHVEFVAATALVARHVPNLIVLIVGDSTESSDGYVSRLVKQIAEGGLTSNVRFTGHLDDAYVAYRASDVLVHCSISPEPFGMIFLEAMDAGTPIVAANSGGPVEILDDGNCGILADPSNTVELASSILRLIADRDLANELVRKGRSRLNANYLPGPAFAKFMAVYEASKRQQ